MLSTKSPYTALCQHQFEHLLHHPHPCTLTSSESQVLSYLAFLLSSSITDNLFCIFDALFCNSDGNFCNVISCFLCPSQHVIVILNYYLVSNSWWSQDFLQLLVSSSQSWKVHCALAHIHIPLFSKSHFTFCIFQQKLDIQCHILSDYCFISHGWNIDWMFLLLLTKLSLLVTSMILNLSSKSFKSQLLKTIKNSLTRSIPMLTSSWLTFLGWRVLDLHWGMIYRIKTN